MATVLSTLCAACTEQLSRPMQATLQLPHADMTADDRLQALEERMREQELWACEHDGRINAKWEEQGKHNERSDAELTSLQKHIDDKFGLVFKELTTLKTKVAIYAAIACSLGTLATKYLLP